MIERLQYYLDEGLVRKISVDKEEAKSQTVYCAANISLEVCKEALIFMESFLPKLRKAFENSQKQ